MKLKTDQVGRAGEAFVVAEILRRGGYAVMFAGNMPGIDILASDAHHGRKVTIQVKTKTSRGWQTSTTKGRTWERDPDDDRFWILVDLQNDQPAYFVIPAWEIEQDIHDAHAKYLAEHGGRRPKSLTSTHHSIAVSRVEGWRNKWDLLGIFEP